MKNNLFAVIALCSATSSSMPLWAATEWNDPQLTFVAPNLTEDPVTGGGIYYVYHVATGKFLSDGNFRNNWGTELEVKDKGQKVTLSWGEDTEFAYRETTDAEYHAGLGWRFTMKDAKSNGGFHELFLNTQDNGTIIMACDHNKQGHILWKIMPQEGGTYRIKIVDSDPKYGVGTDFAAGTMWGVSAGETGVNPILDCDMPENAEAGFDWKFVEPDVYDAFQAKKSLKTALEEAVASGYTDYAAEEALYNNPSATQEEVIEATDNLLHKVLQFKYSSATEENPVDLTLQMKNPAFADGTSGWNFWRQSQMSGGDNLVVQHGRSDLQDENGVVKPTFAERWTATNPSNNSSITQTLTGLPDGKFRLTALVCISGVPEGENPKGAYIVATGLGKEQRKEVTRAQGGLFIKNSTEFSVLGGTAEVGMRVENCNFNWYALADFKLEYLGTAGAENMHTFLESTIKEAEDKVAEYSANNELYSNAGKAKYEETIAAAKEAAANASLTDAELQSMVLSVSSRMDTLALDVAAYRRLPDMVQNLWASYDDASYAGLPCMAAYEEYLGAIETEVADLEYNYADVDSLQPRAQAKLAECIAEGIRGGDIDDVTSLITNPNFDEGSTGWNGGPVIGSGVGEVYQKQLDVYQTLKGLPAGSYKISMNGFYRPTVNADCMTSWNTGEANGDNTVLAYLYGNDAMVKLPHVYEYVYETAKTEQDVLLTLEFDEERNGKYTLNNLSGAAAAFADGDFAVDMVCYVEEGADLRFGVKMPQASGESGYWTAFDNFKISYLGANDGSGLVTPIQALIESAQAELAKTDLSTEEAKENLNKAIADATAALEGELTVEISKTNIAALNEAIEGSHKAISAVAELVAIAEDHDRKLNDGGEGSYDDYMATEEYAVLADDVMNVLDKVDMDAFKTLEEVEADKLKLAQDYADMIASAINFDGASKESPVEVTGMIANPSFSVKNDLGADVSSASGWVITKDGGNTSANELVYEFYNANSCNIHQTLYSLKKGYYRMTFKGFYRAGDAVPAAISRRDNGVDSLYAFAYATVGDKMWKADLRSIFDGLSARKEDSGDIVLADSLFPDRTDLLYKCLLNNMRGARIAFEKGKYEAELFFEVSDPAAGVEIGVQKDKHIANDWMIFDDFRWYYMGDGEANMPDGFDPNSVDETLNKAEEVVATNWYTISGMRISTPVQKGIYIREDVKADGSKNVRKVMVE